MIIVNNYDKSTVNRRTKQFNNAICKIISVITMKLDEEIVSLSRVAYVGITFKLYMKCYRDYTCICTYIHTSLCFN